MSDPAVSTSETELRPLVDRALSAAYELDREIGRGGMGIVYRAKDRRLKRHVAIKLLPPELAFRSEIRSRFLREAETAAQLNHPHIVPIYSVDEADGLVYFVMACVDGDNLGKRIHDRGPLPIDDARRILAEVADALAYAHQRGVVHRDIKPDNILLDSENRALVTDFGIARAIIEGSDARLTATGMAIGTPAYMSPEQSAGDREIDGRSDLYSLGVVAYQMLAGELPFQASSTPAMLVKHLSEIPTPIEQRRGDVPPDLAAVVMRLLEKKPEDRLRDAAELEGMLLGTVAPPSSYNTTRPVAEPAFKVGGGTLGASVYTAPRGAPIPPAADYRNQPPQRFVDAPSAVTGPSSFEEARWEVPIVRDFRKKLGYYVIVNAVILVLALFDAVDLGFLTAVWTIFMAFKYAKLWSEGYDWRDVLKQPRDRLFADVVAEGADSVGAIFDRDRRAKLREKARESRVRGQARRAALPAAGPAAGVAYTPRSSGFGVYADVVRKATSDRDEIARLLGQMHKSDRERIPTVLPSANDLANKIQMLAGTANELAHSDGTAALERIENEIATLESQANPLDRLASEERVKRLAYLKRQRRAQRDIGRRRDKVVADLEQCRLVLENMRLDLVRLLTGSGGSYVNVTTMADRAMALARDVDVMVAAADDVRRI